MVLQGTLATGIIPVIRAATTEDTLSRGTGNLAGALPLPL
jgi:hypothetical protein